MEEKKSSKNIAKPKYLNQKGDVRQRRNKKVVLSVRARFYRKIIDFLNEYNFLNVPSEEIGKISSEFFFLYQEYRDLDAYKTLLSNCNSFLETHAYHANNRKLRSRTRKPSVLRPNMTKYYADGRFYLEKLIPLTTKYYDNLFRSDSFRSFAVDRFSLEHKCLIDFLQRIIYIDERIRDYEKDRTLSQNNQSNNQSETINSDDPDCLNKILELFKITSQEVKVNHLYPLIKNVEFLEMVIENKVLFYTEDEPKLSRGICASLIELSTKKGFRKAGNPKANLNSIVPANDFAREMGPLLDELEQNGFKTLQSKVDELNLRGIKTARDKSWSITTVKRTQDRWGNLKDNITDTKSKSPKPE